MAEKCITFAVVGYHQAAFIREAVTGALNQEYSSLEIILSDDCSTDGTFEIMQEMAAVYRGPHNIILNRNETTLGLGGHLNRIMELSTGDVIIIAAGDDVSLPQRTADTVCFFDQHPDVFYYWTSVERIAEDGKHLSFFQWENQIFGLMDFLHNFSVMGCSAAWRRDLWHQFGPLNEKVVYEDVVLACRAGFLGKIASGNNVTVKYRQNSLAITSLNNRVGKERNKWRNRLLLSYLQICADYCKLSRQSVINYDECDQLFRAIYHSLDVINSIGILDMGFSLRYLPNYCHMLISRSHHPMLKRQVKSFWKKKTTK